MIVEEDQLSVAIGKAGQNVRLAGKLTGYELDVSAPQKAAIVEEEVSETPVEVAEPEKVESKPVVQKIKKKSDLENSLLEAIEEHGTEDSEQTENK